jgi:DNA-binding GntR family transcriptional regulator
MGEEFKSKGKSYTEIAECLFAEIREGKYLAHNSFPSLTRIASRFGVTRVTAMRSVDELKKRGVVSHGPLIVSFVSVAVCRCDCNCRILEL